MKLSTSTFRLLHGRTKPGNPTDIDGNEIEDWGFNGPELHGCIGFHWTYGELYIYFDGDESFEAAQKATGWASHNDWGLTVAFHGDDDGLVVIRNNERNRLEYFGDMDLHPTTESRA